MNDVTFTLELNIDRAELMTKQEAIRIYTRLAHQQIKAGVEENAHMFADDNDVYKFIQQEGKYNGS